ncbi:MAG: UDP-N-acetylmuramoyl-L-alanyl-D-glutamate--2,6-diaminopimelate ligase [Actinobacteria bacterium]|nr:UDP-N-acetylmuramoyl-L-alanyl-D-glutamate--2,6-diaminopimelate ligase [Actinomycetota bacterium]
MQRPITSHQKKLSALCAIVGAESTSKELESIQVSGISQASNAVLPGDLFIALPGQKVHGAQFAAEAISRGAVAVLTDVNGAKEIKGVPVLVSTNPRRAAGIASAWFYSEPMRDLYSVGVTGTNGKTTVTTLLRERHMRNLIMEVSSHAITLERIRGSHFAVVGFTNLSQDHLDFHKDMEDYFAAKAKLFTFEYADLAVINLDNPYGKRLAAQTELPVVTLSRLDSSATWHYASIASDYVGASVSIRGSGGILIEGKTALHGGFNYDNLLMAVAIAVESGIDPLDIAASLPTLTGAAGRLEAVRLGQNFTALVDYAHSPDAVKRVLEAAAEITDGKVIAVLGCGGDRDKTKRTLMGQALHEGADIAIYTSDNPRSEKAEDILVQMVLDIDVVPPSEVIVDRAQAIRTAVNLAQAGDVVMVLGKGHEKGQEINGKVHEFDDRIELAKAIEDKK